MKVLLDCIFRIWNSSQYRPAYFRVSPEMWDGIQALPVGNAEVPISTMTAIALHPLIIKVNDLPGLSFEVRYKFPSCDEEL